MHPSEPVGFPKTGGDALVMLSSDHALASESMKSIQRLKTPHQLKAQKGHSKTQDMTESS